MSAIKKWTDYVYGNGMAAYIWKWKDYVYGNGMTAYIWKWKDYVYGKWEDYVYEMTVCYRRNKLEGLHVINKQ